MLNVELNGTEPEHVERIAPKISVDEHGNIDWVPGLLDHNAKVFHRGKTVTNEEFNELFLQQVYRGNYLTDSLREFFNIHLSSAIRRKFRNDFKLVNSYIQPFTSTDWGEQQADGYYYINIPAATHGFTIDTADNPINSVNIDIEMYLLNTDGLFYEVTQANIDSDNSVVLYTDDTSVPGFVVIRANDKSYALIDVDITVDQIVDIAKVGKTGRYADLEDIDAADGPNTKIKQNTDDILAILTGTNNAGDLIAVAQAVKAVDAAYAKSVTENINNIPLTNIFEDNATSYIVKESRIAHNYSNTGTIANKFTDLDNNIDSVNTNLTNNINTAVTNIQNGNTVVSKANNIKDKNGNFNTLQTALLNMVYPVGSIYLSVNNTNPEAFLGGKWTALPAGKALWTVPSSGTYAHPNTEIPAGLPNITGYINNIAMTIKDSDALSYSGCFTASTDAGQSNADGVGTNAVKIKMDAWRSNDIYGNSTTVQPPAYTVYAWRRYE